MKVKDGDLNAAQKCFISSKGTFYYFQLVIAKFVDK